MIAVDAFCGSGGMTDAMLAAGFQVHGLDVVQRPEYRGTFHHADIRDATGGPELGVDWFHASPPCQRFSLARCNRKTDPPTEADLDLLHEALRLRDELQPTYWSIENVRGAVKWFKPILGNPRLRHGPFYFWGNFPGFLSSASGLNKGLHGGYTPGGRRRGKDRHRDPWLRARLPFELVGPMAVAVGTALKEGSTGKASVGVGNELASLGPRGATVEAGPLGVAASHSGTANGKKGGAVRRNVKPSSEVGLRSEFVGVELGPLGREVERHLGHGRKALLSGLEGVDGVPDHGGMGLGAGFVIAAASGANAEGGAGGLSTDRAGDGLGHADEYTHHGYKVAYTQAVGP